MRYNKAKSTKATETFVSFLKHIVITSEGEILNFDGHRVYEIVDSYFGTTKNTSIFSTCTTERQLNEAIQASGLKKFEALEFIKSELNCVAFEAKAGGQEFESLCTLIRHNDNFKVLAASFGR